MPDYLFFAMAAQTAIPSLMLCKGDMLFPLFRRAGWGTVAVLSGVTGVGMLSSPDPVFVALVAGALFPAIMFAIACKMDAYEQ